MGDYQPRPRSALEESSFAANLGEVDGWQAEIVVRIWMYRNQIRDFAILIWAYRDDQRYQVECVDCCDGELHRHRMIRSAPDDRQRDRHRIHDLNRGDETIVDAEYLNQYDWMLGNWEAAVRRWALKPSPRLKPGDFPLGAHPTPRKRESNVLPRQRGYGRNPP